MHEYRRVLAATDESPQGSHAVDVACRIARGSSAVLDVVTVCSQKAPALRAGEKPVPCLTAMTELHGVPGVEIVHYAEASHADLLVLGRSPRDRTAPAMLGPTSDSVIRRRSGPTLLVPAAIERFEHLLIALDGSRRGLSVLGPAAAFARVMGADRTIVCVLPATPDALADDAGWVDPRCARVHEAAATGNGVGPIKTLVRVGDPVAGILQAIEELRADGVVIGVRRGGPPGELGSGHVGRDILRAARVAVLTVPI